MTTATQSISSVSQSLLDSVNGIANKTKASTQAEAQDRFLKLLTTQLKNQDPLNPMDNAQMTSQLAQISTVDGITKLNATLEKMMASSVNAEAMQAAAMVGRSVMVAGNGLNLTDNGAVGGYELSSGADQVVLSIKDANGLVIKTINLGNQDAGQHNFTWDGASDAGTQAANGAYQIGIEAKRGADKVAVAGLELASVIGINRSTQGVSLDLGRLGIASMSDIKQIF